MEEYRVCQNCKHHAVPAPERCINGNCPIWSLPGWEPKEPAAEPYYRAKDDRGKLPLNLIPVEWVEGLGEVLQFGAEKYGANSWRSVPDAIERYEGALLRHFYSYKKGKWKSDDGLAALLQVATNALFLFSLAKPAEVRKLDSADIKDWIRSSHPALNGEEVSRVFENIHEYAEETLEAK